MRYIHLLFVLTAISCEIIIVNKKEYLDLLQPPSAPINWQVLIDIIFIFAILLCFYYIYRIYSKLSELFKNIMHIKVVMESSLHKQYLVKRA